METQDHGHNAVDRGDQDDMDARERVAPSDAEERSVVEDGYDSSTPAERQGDGDPGPMDVSITEQEEESEEAVEQRPQ